METRKPLPPTTEQERMERYGYRDIPRKMADGRTEYDRVALTVEDLLHPQFGDVAVESTVHDLERGYLASVFRARLHDDSHALVLSDCGIFWDLDGMGHHAPDVAVIFGVNDPQAYRKSFDVTEEGTRPRLIIEIVSPESRVNDVETKVNHYQQVRVPFYFIVDREHEDDVPRLIGYSWTPQEYVPIAPGEDGRLWLESVGVWLGVADGRVACWDPVTGERLGDYTEVSVALAEARLRLEAETQRANDATRQAKKEANRAEKEANRAELAEQARQAAERAKQAALDKAAEDERQLRKMELEMKTLQAELRKLRGET